jgi:diadenosine tetraphosphatase ApaH/serine/threonine PP2A family protein phosphatase
MRYLVLSDLHANLEALEAVLHHAEGTWDRVIVLGDLVGYGADPDAVVDRIRSLMPIAVIRGNHDKAAAGVEDASNFNPAARAAAMWTARALGEANRAFLQSLPAGPLLVDDVLEICHGSPFDEDFYIFDGEDAWRALESTRSGLCFYGHTHVALAFLRSGNVFEAIVPEGTETPIQAENGRRLLVNPGSVGQPRDGDPRAAYAVYDSAEGVVTLRRAPYAVERAQEKILAAGLPRALANRLASGR